jgi:hypothetical protein
LRYGFYQIKKEIEELKITRGINELFVEIYCTSIDSTEPCVVNLKQTNKIRTINDRIEGNNRRDSKCIK